jgi:surface-anchored protein
MRVRSRSALVTGILVAAALTVGVLPASASHRVVLSEGHVDVLDIAVEDGQLEVVVHDETVEPGVERDPDTVLFQAKPESETTVPAGAPQFGFLGDPGDPVWILPQDNVEGLLFAGFSTEELESGVVKDDTVSIRLVNVCGPADVSLFTVDALDQVTKLADSGDGLPDVIRMGVLAHQHSNWAFEAEGNYQLTFVVTARLASNNRFVSSGPVNIRFHVGALS